MAKARNTLITQLKEDHQRVKKAYARYRRLDAEADAEARQALLLQVLDELELHARLEEMLLYPEARAALSQTERVDEAVVEHEMLHLLMEQIRPLASGGEEQQARFTVLCEYTMHHVKEEEREMFPQLMKVKLDWLRLAREFEDLRAQLLRAREAPQTTMVTAMVTAMAAARSDAPSGERASSPAAAAGAPSPARTPEQERRKSRDPGPGGDEGARPGPDPAPQERPTPSRKGSRVAQPRGLEDGPHEGAIQGDSHDDAGSEAAPEADPDAHAEPAGEGPDADTLATEQAAAGDDTASPAPPRDASPARRARSRSGSATSADARRRA